MTTLDRRGFLKRAAFAGGALLGGTALQGLVSCAGLASRGKVTVVAGPGEGGYGQLVPAGAELALPRGFTYSLFGVERSIMSDDRPTPRAHDGMAAFALPNGNIRLIRNHEDRGPPAAPISDRETAYDISGAAGTTSLEVEPFGERKLVRDYVSLAGTIYNCAGGPTPWGSWLSCEEATWGPSKGFTRRHGYVFEVATAAGWPVEPVPLTAMGRFEHEAVAVDPATGIVYQTEDKRRSGFFRFIPDKPGDLAAGGPLQMLAIEGRPRYDTATGQKQWEPLPVTWIDIPDPDPPEVEEDGSAVFKSGYNLGGARFRRLEGCWYGEGSIFFDATYGGDAALGQIWQYTPDADGGVLRLLFESPDRSVLGGPDNVCVSPRGGIVLCEDSPGPQHIRGLTPDGRIFDFARNLVNDREFAGACFSPDGHTLFVNIQGDTSPGGAGRLGMTFAIWGPWEEGVL